MSGAKGARARLDGDEGQAPKMRAGREEQQELAQSQGLVSYGRHSPGAAVPLRGFEQRTTWSALGVMMASAGMRKDLEGQEQKGGAFLLSRTGGQNISSILL